MNSSGRRRPTAVVLHLDHESPWVYGVQAQFMFPK